MPRDKVDVLDPSEIEGYARPTLRIAKLAALLTLVVAILAAPLAAGAQPAGKVWRIGMLVFGGCAGPESSFQKALRDLGYTEGQNLVIECRSAKEDYARLPQAAAELVQLKVDVIAALNHPAARAAQQATTTIPIVMVASGDPVASGFVASLGRPGGNVTGVTYYATELTSKRLQLLKELVPGATRIGVLSNPALAYLPFVRDTEHAAPVLGLAARVVDVSAPTDLAKAFSTMARERVDAVFVLPDLMLARQARAIADLALKYRLPTMSWGRWFVVAGGLAAYAADYEGMDRRAAVYVDKLLRGAKPADLPVEQPTTFELVINLKTANALGLAMPQSLLMRVDEVIQ